MLVVQTRLVVRTVFFELGQPRCELSPLLSCDRWVDQGVTQQLPALLDVAAILDGMRQDHGDDLQILRFSLSVPWTQQRQVGQQLGHRFLFGH